MKQIIRIDTTNSSEEAVERDRMELIIRREGYNLNAMMADLDVGHRIALTPFEHYEVRITRHPRSSRRARESERD